MAVRKINNVVKRCIISIYYEEQMSMDKIAHELDISRTTVTNIINYGSNRNANEHYAKTKGFMSHANYLKDWKEKRRSFEDKGQLEYLLNNII